MLSSSVLVVACVVLSGVVYYWKTETTEKPQDAHHASDCVDNGRYHSVLKLKTHYRPRPFCEKGVVADHIYMHAFP